jgi:LmbE family N-acetylglucosaminyl deacetylase/GT2 family glycosyltransferase
VKPLYSPLLDPNGLPNRVLVIAPHADDEVFGCGGMLCFHADRGDQVRVVVLTDGAAGDPDGTEADIQAAREAESRAAGEALGVTDHRFLGLPDGGLADVADLQARLEAELDDFDPDLVYAPSPQEMHPDHRTTSAMALRALAAGRERRVLLYGVNAQVTAGALFDTTRFWERKQAAIEAFTSQLHYHDLVGKAIAVDRSRTVNIEDPNIRYVEGFADLGSGDVLDYEARVGSVLAAVVDDPGLPGAQAHAAAPAADAGAPEPAHRAGRQRAGELGLPGATAVISTWNKADDVCENLAAIEKQELPFEEVVVVDNASGDDTVQQITERFPWVRVIVMPNSAYGACETFNIGFASVTTPLMAILDDDVVLPPDWLAKTTRRMAQEPESTAIVSTKVVEPEMPESYKNSEKINRERYMSTFRGCGSLAKVEPLRRAGFYDERLFIYGNERDLTCRLLNLGCRVLQYPQAETFHKTPFGIQMGKRSLYFHARNAWLTQLKYAPAGDLVKLPFLVLSKVLLRSSKKEVEGEVTDATGTIGLGKSLKQKGALWTLVRAGWGVLVNVPYCLKHRAPVRHEDFELPLG